MTQVLGNITRGESRLVECRRHHLPEAVERVLRQVEALPCVSPISCRIAWIAEVADDSGENETPTRPAPAASSCPSSSNRSQAHASRERRQAPNVATRTGKPRATRKDLTDKLGTPADATDDEVLAALDNKLHMKAERETRSAEQRLYELAYTHTM